MNIKRYRAATMRDALEKVKSDLGDEALVLGSKQVRSGGFLGFGGTDLVEVRVSSDFTPATPKAKSRDSKTAPRKSSLTSLSLNDGDPALPSPTPAFDSLSSATFSALKARAYTAESLANSKSKSTNSAATSVQQPVWKKNAAVKAQIAAETDSARPANSNQEPTETPTSKRDSLSGELDRLRAEMREVKFTLTAFQRNQVPHSLSQSTTSLADADEQIYDSPFYETYLHLGSLGIQPELARAAVRAVAIGNTEGCDVQQLAQIGLLNALPSWITFENDPLVYSAETGRHPVVALVGPTGVGKTTTIAKLAARVALRERRRVEMITLDTYRIAAVDQLKTYAEIIGAGFHVPRSILELDSLVRRFAGEATVLIDTIGRSARDLADQIELADYLRGNEEIVKCLVIQATTHPTDALLAVKKFGLFGAQRLIVTKLDETSRSGAAISVAVDADLPLIYLCNGQRVPEDIEKATAESVVAATLRAGAFAVAA